MTKWTKRRMLADQLVAAGFVRVGAGARWDAYGHDDMRGPPAVCFFLGEKGEMRFGERWTHSVNFGFWRDRMLTGTHYIVVEDGKIGFKGHGRHRDAA